MSYEEEFDKIVRDKVGEADYPFDESNWAKTSRLIDADRAATRKAAVKKLFLPVALVVGGVILFMVSQVDDVNTSLAKHQQEIGAQTEDNLALVQQADASESQTQFSGTKSEPLNSNAPVVAPANTAGQQSGKNINQNGSQANADQLALSGTGTEPEDKEATNAGKADASPASDKSGSDVQAGKSKDGGSVPEKIAPVNRDKPEDQTVKPEPLREEGKPLAGSDDDKSIEPALASPAANSHVELVEADVLSAQSAMLPYSSANDAKLPFVFLSRYEPDYFSKKPKTHFLNAEFGGSYLFGWNTSSGKDAQGLNWFAGLNYGYYLGKFSVGAGAQVYNITNIQKEFYGVEQKEYGFGSTRTYTTVTTNDLYFLSVPVRISYHINRSNHIGLGFNAGYLVKMNNTVQGYDIVEGGRTEKPKSTLGNSTMYEGVSSWNYMGSVYYNARLNNRLALHGEFVYSFADLFQNNSSVSNAEKPMGLRVGLQYYLFDK